MSSSSKSINVESLPLRAPEVVMDLERLGSMHQTRLSFMRSLIRRIMREHWLIKPELLELDHQGYGTAIYSVSAPEGRYSFVLFSNHLDPEQRNDRVIASQWDLTMALCEGDVNSEQLESLRCNVPLQEAGRVNSKVFVLSRANRSARNFDYVVDCLAKGEQPNIDRIGKAGYLYRTTAVYGSGKLGMADWDKVKTKYPDFARPFSAEMFVCYMLRSFSLLQAEHIAKHRSPTLAVLMDKPIQRYFGIGNSTGLGMAPYLINHPLLVSRWIEARETALAKVVKYGEVDKDKIHALRVLVNRVIRHITGITVNDEGQGIKNQSLIEGLNKLLVWIDQNNEDLTSWYVLQNYVSSHLNIETQELVVGLLIELYPSLVDELEDSMTVDEIYDLQPEMPIVELKSIIEKHYLWAIDIDFESKDSQKTFWYRSEEKMEPRLGQVDVDDGKEKEMPMAIALYVRECYDIITSEIEINPNVLVVDLLLSYPEIRGIVRRIQTMAKQQYGDIHANLLAKNVLPMHLLRCKLSFFGVSKYDPRSRLWVQNTMYQGASLLSDIGQEFKDDWFFPIAPVKSCEAVL